MIKKTSRTQGLTRNTLLNAGRGLKMPWWITFLIPRMKRLTFPLALFFIFAGFPAAFADWPMFLKDAVHSSYAEKAPNPPFTAKWQFSTGGPVYSSPVVAGKKVFAGSYDKSLYALDAQTGKLLWSFATEGEILGTPAVSNGAVYFGSKDAKIYALDASTGKLLWSFATEGPVLTSALVVNGIVYAGSKDLYLYALDAAKGKRLWRMKLPDFERYGAIYSSPAYFDGAVYIAGKNGAIYSFDAKSGGRNWAARTYSAMYSSPVIKDGVLYAASYGTKFYAIDARKGKMLWVRDLNGEPAYSTPVIVRDRIYLGLKYGHVKVYETNRGIEKADYKLPAGIDSTPVLASTGALLACGMDGVVYSIDTASGNISPGFAAKGAIHASPAVEGDTIYVGSTDGNIYALVHGERK